MSRIAVVGAGISGVACARELVAGGHDVTVLERSHSPGGRLASRTLHGRPVDLGASYFTAGDDRFQPVVDDWVARGIAHPWTWELGVAGSPEPKRGPLRYGARAGLRSLVEDLAAGLPLQPDTTVTSVGPGPTVDGRAYDTVVLAMPDPQALALLAPGLPKARALLTGRTWDPVLALAVGFATRGWDLDGLFVNDDPVLAWVADDGRRRNDGAPVLVAHSTSAFAVDHLADPVAAAPALVASLRALLDLPEPAWSHVQRWTYAKPVGARDAPFGLVGPAGAPVIGLCGDGWGAAKVEGAWLSGHLLGRALCD